MIAHASPLRVKLNRRRIRPICEDCTFGISSPQTPRKPPLSTFNPRLKSNLITPPHTPDWPTFTLWLRGWGSLEHKKVIHKRERRPHVRQSSTTTPPKPTTLWRMWLRGTGIGRLPSASIVGLSSLTLTLPSLISVTGTFSWRYADPTKLGAN